jgi:hypothetical protein
MDVPEPNLPGTISQNVWGPSWMMANRARIIESVDDVIAFGRKHTGGLCTIA